MSTRGEKALVNLNHWLGIAEMYRQSYPVDSHVYPDVLDRWAHWYRRESGCAFRGMAMGIGSLFMGAYQALEPCIVLRRNMATGDTPAYEVRAERVWAAEGALKAVENRGLVKRTRHGSLYAALARILGGQVRRRRVEKSDAEAKEKDGKAVRFETLVGLDAAPQAEELVMLPLYPMDLQCRCDYLEPMIAEHRPKGPPRKPVYLGAVSWYWSPGNSRWDRYYVSSTRRFWLLWLKRDPREGETGWPGWTLYAYGRKEYVSLKTAATFLLMRAWDAENKRGVLGNPGYIRETGYHSAPVLAEIARQVWRKWENIEDIEVVEGDEDAEPTA